MSGTARQVPIQPTNGASQCRRASAGMSTRGISPDRQTEPGEDDRRAFEENAPGQPVGEGDHAAADQDQRHAIRRGADAVRRALLLRAHQRDRVGVDRHVLGGRGDGQGEDQRDEDDQAARGVGHGEQGHDDRDHQHGAGHPVPAVAEALDQRRPEELQGERELEEAEPADRAQRGAVPAEVDRQHLPQDAHRAALDEVEQSHDSELGSRRRGQPAGAEQRPQEAHRAHCTPRA